MAACQPEGIQRRGAPRGGAARDGALDPPLDLDTLAYLLARIAESFLYTNVITGDEPDPLKAGQATRVLLSAPAPSGRSSAPSGPRPRRRT